MKKLLTERGLKPWRKVFLYAAVAGVILMALAFFTGLLTVNTKKEVLNSRSSVRKP